MILAKEPARFDFDAPRVNGDGSAVITVRCFVGDTMWGAKDINLSKADVDSVVERETTPGVSRRADIYLAFGQWLIECGIIAGEIEMPAEMKR